MAGALGVQLGGPSSYQGVRSEKPRLGDPKEPLSLEKVRQGIRLVQAASWLALALASGLALLLAGAGAAWLR
jgi:adenosylcobinamide-phosphate synthase